MRTIVTGVPAPRPGSRPVVCGDDTTIALVRLPSRAWSGQPAGPGSVRSTTADPEDALFSSDPYHAIGVRKFAPGGRHGTSLDTFLQPQPIVVALLRRAHVVKAPDPLTEGNAGPFL